MASDSSILDSPAFASYAFYAAIVILKMFLMGLLTSTKRGATGIYANEEDVDFFYKGKDKDKSKRIKFDNDAVERVRRNHLNDLENIPAFLILALLYITTGASASSVLWHCRVFVWSRIAHTAVYQLAVPQPARATTYMVGLAANVSMAIQIIMKFR